MFKIMVVEPNVKTAREISDALKGLDAEILYSKGSELFLRMDETHPDLILMDTILDCADGFSLCAEIRKFSDVPVLLMSGGDVRTVIEHAVSFGADDVIAKPVDGPILRAKIRALIRRTGLHEDGQKVCGNEILMTRERDSLYVNNEVLDLSKNEYRILLVLVRNRGSVVRRETLIHELWKTDTYIDENTLSVNVGRLRKKLDAAGLSNFIDTIFGEGYIVKEEAMAG